MQSENSDQRSTSSPITKLSVACPNVGKGCQERGNHVVVGVGPGGRAIAESMAADRKWALYAVEMKDVTSDVAAVTGQRDGDSRQLLHRVLGDTNLLFLTFDARDCGSVSLAVSLAQARDILTLAFVHCPSMLDQVTEVEIRGLGDSVDATIMVPQDGVCTYSSQETMTACILAILEVLTVPGLLRVDMADLEIVARDAGGLGCVGIVRKQGHRAAVIAAHGALKELQEQTSLDSVGGGALLFQVGTGFSLADVNEAGELVVATLPSQALFVSNIAICPDLPEKAVLATLMVFGL